MIVEELMTRLKQIDSRLPVRVVGPEGWGAPLVRIVEDDEPAEIYLTAEKSKSSMRDMFLCDNYIAALHGAIACGYGHPKNAKKTIDPDLISAIVKEVIHLNRVFKDEIKGSAKC